MNLGAAWRRTSAAAALLVSACQPLPHPFAEDAPKPGSPMLALRDTATVAIAPLQGEPLATAEKLAAAMAAALQQRDIAASDKAVGIASYQLDGRVQAMPPSAGRAAIVVLWDLRDPEGRSVGTRAERIVDAADAWQQGRDDAVARLADAGAEQIAAMLHDKAPVETAAETPAPETPDTETPVVKTPAAQGRDTDALAAKSPAAEGAVRLLIGTVSGAPGNGAMALAGAIAALLKQQDGLAIVSSAAGKADLQLDCAVTIDKPAAGKQHVKIVWRVQRKDGAEIGNVIQENDVPAGLLDGTWGDVAYMVALAAADGILQLIARGAPAATGNS
jgi:hypothetical protein